ncbi:MAG TPA: 8-amino-7-oxononanoate synthase [Phycisphaerae bacterium]|nr:8-amino-7-oxononanoate synthase [Phycisphaerae bacterium]HRY69490.1 8-amino-7-oxononanoate synthase [Phycisphaerae bacterium]HSA29096.1 8-amino-7-oxononanoate synthase [Phycisphaerae bacterium]
MTVTRDSPWAEQLADLVGRGLHRSLRTVESAPGRHLTADGRRLICFSSNNYLGLAAHPAVALAAKAAIERWGWGSGASALISGYTAAHAELADRLAAFESAEASLVCSTGYQANLAAIRGLAGPGDVILLDKLDHASIIDGARGSGAVVRVCPHRDYAKLRRLLERGGAFRRRIIVTDSVFSMDGDLADLPRLVELKRRYEAILCVDEAHATGVLGLGGRGAAELMNVAGQVDVTVGTLSKALGGVGGFVAGSRLMIDWLVNTARAFIYTTALPPAACAAAGAALELVRCEPWRRVKVLDLAERMRSALASRGWDTGPSCTQIVPVIVGSSERALRLSGALEREGILVPAIRPPTVPGGGARLRISLSAEHEPEDVAALVQALERHRDGC